MVGIFILINNNNDYNITWRDQPETNIRNGGIIMTTFTNIYIYIIILLNKKLTLIHISQYIYMQIETETPPLFLHRSLVSL